MIDAATLRRAVLDQLSMQQETRDPDAVLAAAGFTDVDRLLRDLSGLAHTLSEQNPGASAPAENLAVGLAHGVAIGARAQRDSET